MKHFFRYFAIALAVIAFFGTFVFLYQKSRPAEVKYQEFTAAPADISKSTVVTGKIQPRNEVDIKPQINGIVSELYKEAGQSVKEGDVIAKVKVIPEMASLSSAQSRVKLADINLSQAKTNFEREKALYEKKLISDEAFEQVKQLLDQAQAERDAAQDALEVVRDGVSASNAKSSSTLVRSTISGLILAVPVKVGNSVIQANTFNDGTTIATVADMKDLIFDGNIDETDVGKLYEGMPVRITVGALQDVTFEAVLEYISPKAVENNGANQFEIKAAVKVPEGSTIRSGYSANAEIILKSAQQVLSVPESTIEFSGDSTFVYVKAGETYERKEVKTGVSDGVNIEILSGISKGDKIRGPKIIAEK